MHALRVGLTPRFAGVGDCARSTHLFGGDLELGGWDFGRIESGRPGGSGYLWSGLRLRCLAVILANRRRTRASVQFRQIVARASRHGGSDEGIGSWPYVSVRETVPEPKVQCGGQCNATPKSLPAFLYETRESPRLTVLVVLSDQTAHQALADSPPGLAPATRPREGVDALAALNTSVDACGSKWIVRMRHRSRAEVGIRRYSIRSRSFSSAPISNRWNSLLDAANRASLCRAHIVLFCLLGYAETPEARQAATSAGRCNVVRLLHRTREAIDWLTSFGSSATPRRDSQFLPRVPIDGDGPLIPVNRSRAPTSTRSSSKRLARLPPRDHLRPLRFFARASDVLPRI